MDVGIVTAPLDFGPSGPNVYLENLCDALLDLEADDLDLHLIHYQHSDADVYERANDVILPRTPGLFERNIAKLDLDILHYNYIPYKRPLIFGLAVPKVVTVHGDLPFALPDHVSWKRRNLEVPIQRAYARFGLLDRVAEYVTVSDALGRSLSRELGIPGRKLTTIYPGIDEFYSPRPDAATSLREKYGITQPYFLNVNNYMEKKNRTSLLRAFASVRERYSDTTLVLAGGRWEQSNVADVISDLELDEAVLDLGFVPKEDLPLLYTAAVALVNPTLRETFGFTNLEAMACGCPVVTSDAFAIPEVVGDAALLVSDPTDTEEIANKMTAMLANDATRAEFASSGRQRAGSFTWEKTAEETASVYRRVVENEQTT